MTPKPATRDRTFTISTPRQYDAVSAPVRREIIEVMLRLGRCTIADVATRMDRSPESLYYHMKMLRQVGVIRLVESRRGRRQFERVFELTAREFRIKYSPTAAFRRAYLKSVRSLMSLTVRQTEDAIESRRAVVNGPRRTVRTVRSLSTLSDEHLEELNERLDELHQWIVEVHDQQAPHRIAMTMAVCTVP